MNVVTTSDDFGSYYHDADTGRPLKYDLTTGAYLYADGGPQATSYVDTRGLFGSAGTTYDDGRYGNQNDYNTWTDPNVVAVDKGINPATGLPYTRADAGFTAYTDLAQKNGQEEAARQAAAHGGGFGDLLPMLVIGGLILATGPMGAGLWGAEAGAAAAGGYTGTIAELAADGLGGVATGSSLTSSVLTNAAIGAGTSAVRGGDPLMGAITGGIGGYISGSGLMGDVASAITPEGASSVVTNAISKGVNAATTGAISTVAQGGSFGDALEAGVASGITSGAGNYVSGTVLNDTGSNTAAGAAGGAVAGGTSALLNGGDIGTGILTGAAGGAAGGAATDAGAGPVTAGAIGSVAGGLIGSSLQPDAVDTSQTAATPTPATTTATDGDISWGDLVPSFIHAPRADMAWGTRLSGA